MKRFFRLLATLLAVVFLASCSSSPTPSPSVSAGLESVSTPADTGSSSGAEIALLTTEARLATAFGQSVQQTVSRFAGESGLTSATYKAENGDESAALSTLELAAKGGAQLVLCMDPVVTAATASAQSRYPDIDFILLDGSDETQPGKNAAQLTFPAIQAGWLAGYAAVAQGWETLGCLASDSDSSRLYALGFLLGAESAAARLAPFGEEKTRVSVTYFEVAAALEEEDESEAIRRELDGPLDKSGVVFAPLAEYCDLAEWQGDPTVPAILLKVPSIRDFTQGSVLATVEHEPKKPLASLLTDWQKNRFPAGKSVPGNARDGDVVLEVGQYAESDFAASLEQAQHQFSDGTLAKQLERVQTSGPEGGIPSWQDIEFFHIDVRIPSLGEEEPVVSGPSDSSTEASLPPAPSSLPAA